VKWGYFTNQMPEHSPVSPESVKLRNDSTSQFAGEWSDAIDAERESQEPDVAELERLYRLKDLRQ